MRGIFNSWQPAYAVLGIATFPVNIYRDEAGKAAKVPAVKNYARFGLAGSRAIANRFARARALGFVAGSRSRITALDIDSSDERLLANALDKYGRTQVIIRSGGSGHFQAWYRHNGEKRAIRQLGDEPIDVLGGGVVVAPPSQGLVRSYEFIQGDLDEIARLPKLVNLPQYIYRAATIPQPKATPAMLFARAHVTLPFGCIACSRPTIAMISMRCSMSLVLGMLSSCLHWKMRR
jgi:hypothetical protein